MFCTKCGTQFDGGFCPSCGTPAARPVQQPNAQQAGQRPAAGYQQRPQQGVQGAPANYQQAPQYGQRYAAGYQQRPQQGAQGAPANYQQAPQYGQRYAAGYQQRPQQGAQGAPANYQQASQYGAGYQQPGSQAYNRAGAFNPQSGAGEKSKKEHKTKTHKLSKGKKIAVSVVAVVLVLAIVFSSVACATLSKPTVKFGSALQKTLFESKSFAFEFNEVITGREYNFAKGNITFGSDLAATSFYADIFDGEFKIIDNAGTVAGYEYHNNEVYNAFAVDADGIMSWISKDGDKYFKQLRNVKTEEGEVAEYYGKMLDSMGFTINSLMELVYDVVNENGINEDTIETVYDAIISNAEENNGYVEEAETIDIDYDSLPDYAQFKKIITKLLTKIDKEAISVKKSYTKDGVKMYDLDVDVYKLLDECWEFFKEDSSCKELYAAFVNAVDSVYDYDDFEKGLEEMLDDIREEMKDHDLDVVYGTESGYLAYLKFVVNYDDENYAGYELKLSDFGESFDYASDYKEIVAQVNSTPDKTVIDAKAVLAWIKEIIGYAD